MSRFNTRSIILFILLFIATAANARSFAVKGIAIDSDGEPEIYATVRIFQQNDSVKPVSMGEHSAAPLKMREHIVLYSFLLVNLRQ